ncbi:hypothetical protein [uncultured Marinobacter sp.]|uniref:hypothetical protein n=1 Tax=uncultured Marinobacter sp. TaxID=187379 RepID=UPI0030D7A554
MTRNWQKSPFVLLITVAGTLTFGSAAHSETLNWQATPLYGTVSLTAGFQPDPHLVEIDAGGTTNVEPVLKNNCLGYVNSEAPDVDVNYTPGSYPLTFSVMSDADTTLVIYDPDGNWYCNDDFSGESHSNPGVVFERPPAGNYNVWVGTYGNDGNTPKAISGSRKLVLTGVLWPRLRPPVRRVMILSGVTMAASGPMMTSVTIPALPDPAHTKPMSRKTVTTMPQIVARCMSGGRCT